MHLMICLLPGFQISNLNQLPTLGFLFSSLNDSQCIRHNMLFLTYVSSFILVSLPRMLLMLTLEPSRAYLYLKCHLKNHLQETFHDSSFTFHPTRDSCTQLCSQNTSAYPYSCIKPLYYRGLFLVFSTGRSKSNLYFYP